MTIALLLGMAPGRAVAGPREGVVENPGAHAADFVTPLFLDNPLLSSPLIAAPDSLSFPNKPALAPFHSSYLPAGLPELSGSTLVSGWVSDEPPPNDELDEEGGLTAPQPEPWMADVALLPHSLSLTSTQSLLTLGQAVTLTVQVVRNAQSALGEVALTVGLPTAFRVLESGDSAVGGDTGMGQTLTWHFPALEEDGLFERQIVIIVEEGSEGDSFAVEARLSAEEYRSPVRRLLLGIPWADSELLLLPEEVTPGSRGRAIPAVGKATTGGTPAPDNYHLLLPLLTGDGAKESSAEEHFVRTWQINRLQSRQADDADGMPVLVLIDVSELVGQGVPVSQLGLWMQSDGEGEWERVNARYDATQQLFQARLQVPVAGAERSQNPVSLGLGDGLKGDGILPTLTAFATNDFTGEATVAYPIETPAGLGGLQPGLSLNYSSGTIDSLLRDEGDYGNGTQGDWSGLGWSLGGMSYIARDLSDLLVKRYWLVLNGMSAEIRQVNGQYITDPEQFLRIDGRTEGDFWQHDMDDWVITTPDGMKYWFGADQFDSSGHPIGNWTETYLNNDFLNTAWKTRRLGSRWYLRRVEDVLGNRMEYTYDRETDESNLLLPPTCLKSGEVGRWYTQATYLRYVTWNANGSFGPLLRVELNREARPDYAYPKARAQSCEQAKFGYQRLRSIRVQALTAGVWQSLREIVLNQSYYKTQQHDHSGYSRLDSIQAYGKGGYQGNNSNLISTYSFTYFGYTSNHLRLQTANNGAGGSTSWFYDPFEVTDCSGVCKFGVDTNGWPDHYRVKTVRLEDGQSPAVVISTTHVYAEPRGNMVNNDKRYEYLGHKVHQSWTHTLTNTTNSGWVIEQSVANTFRQRTSTGDVDPARGRVKESVTYNGAGAVMASSSITWTVTPRSNGSNWVRKEQEKQYTYDWDGGDNGYSQRTDYVYETNYGNLIEVKEWNQAESQLVRRTVTDYYPNTSAYIVNRPGRVLVYDGGNTCVGESRMLYDGAGAYTTPPSKGLVTQRLQKLTGSCPASGTTVALTDTAWQISGYEYDNGAAGVGNLTRQWVEGTGLPAGRLQEIRTEFDTVYRLFPVRRYNASNSGLDETASYYGVNGLAVSDGKAYWGRLQEYCASDDFCTRQSYDTLGRPAHRWERLTSGQTWPSDAAAATRWLYIAYQSANPSQRATIVVEWNAPRCEGNFTRKLYNGFGQLIQVQTPQENWSTNVDGCGTTGNPLESVVDYAYDGLGRQIRVSVPRSSTFAWLHTPNWGNGYTSTAYDGLGRPLTIESANQVTTQYIYTTRITAADVLEEGNRRLSWSEMDELGNTKKIRSYYWSGSNRIPEGEIVFGYKGGTNLLTSVQFNDLTPGNSGNNKLLSTMTYDLAGRKLTMNDEDLGNWSYVYDQLGRLTRQTDARSKSVCLGYNALGQVTSKTVYDNSLCSGGVAAGYTYNYDSLGRSTGVSQNTGGNWSRSLTYDTLGRPDSETVTIDGISKTMTTYYDAYQRPYATHYPDGEVVKVNYNSLGLPKLMCPANWNSGAGAYYCIRSEANKSQSPDAWYVSDAGYDVAGRLTKMRMPAGNVTNNSGNLWRTQTYHSWTDPKNGGLLNEIRVGTTDGGNQLFQRQYTYNSFGDVATLKEGTTTYNFTYDPMGRLASAYDNLATPAVDPLETFAYDAAGRMTSGGKSYNSSRPYHAPVSSNYGSHVYDTNGNLTSAGSGSSFVWNAENRLQSATKNGVTESYAYDADGNRLKKGEGGKTTYTFFGGQYEEEMTNGTESVWVEDSLPAGATPVATGGDSWSWVTTPKQSGAVAHTSANAAGVHQHYFTGATQTLAVGSNDLLYAWIYLDPANPPRQVMLQWNDGDWEHRAYWGENLITCCGVNGTNSRRSMGALPEKGKWVRLEVPAEAVGLAGSTVSGMAFTLYDGKATWDRAGKFARTVASVKHYSFNGMPIAIRTGGTLRYTHTDHLGSSSGQTDTSGNAITDSYLRYYAYGTLRSGDPSQSTTDRTFTGQKQDSTGLMYYNARFYDPALGVFLSPDTLVPDPNVVIDYNRFLYGSGNPVKYSDPSGHFSEDQLREWYGDGWRSLFTDEWIQLLLDQEGSQLFGAQLGDLVVTGNVAEGLTRSILILDATGQPTLWNTATKTGTSLASVGGISPNTLALYRLVGGESGAADTRYGYLMGGTKFLPATNGAGWGAFKMVMGRGGQGHYVHNFSQFQGLSMDLVSWASAMFTVAGAYDTAVNVVVALRTGASIGARGPIVATGSLVVTVYQASKYRQIYQMHACPAFGPNYCP